MHGPPQDKMSLQNAKSRLHVLETQLRDLTWEHEVGYPLGRQAVFVSTCCDASCPNCAFMQVLEQRFHHVEKERDELYEKFESTIYDVQQKSGFKNILLERKLQVMKIRFLTC